MIHAFDHGTDGEPQGSIQWPHLRGVALDQIVVDGDHLHRDAGHGRGGGRQGGGQCLALAGLHFHQQALEHGPAI
jgi:hypothetical protein